MSEKKTGFFSEFMSGVFGVAAIAPGIIAGGTHALYKLATEDKEAAKTAFEDTFEKVFDGACEVGEEYGPEILMGIVTIVAGGQINEQLKKR